MLTIGAQFMAEVNEELGKSIDQLGMIVSHNLSTSPPPMASRQIDPLIIRKQNVAIGHEGERRGQIEKGREREIAREKEKSALTGTSVGELDGRGGTLGMYRMLVDKIGKEHYSSIACEMNQLKVGGVYIGNVCRSPSHSHSLVNKRVRR